MVIYGISAVSEVKRERFYEEPLWGKSNTTAKQRD